MVWYPYLLTMLTAPLLLTGVFAVGVINLQRAWVGTSDFHFSGSR